MLLRKIDGEMNIQNCGFFAKWRRWRHAPRLTATSVITDSCHRFSKRWHVSDVKNIAGLIMLIVHRNSAILCVPSAITSVCSAADGSDSCHAPALSYFEEMTRCRRQKLHWRWPGNPNGRSKFRNLGLCTFTWSQQTLRRRLRGWWRLPEITQTARNRHQKHRRDDQNRSKFRKYENLCLWDQAKRLEKLLFAATNVPRLTALRTIFFLLSLATAFVFSFEI